MTARAPSRSRKSNKVQNRQCRNCGKRFSVDAAGMKKHASDCLESRAPAQPEQSKVSAERAPAKASPELSGKATRANLSTAPSARCQAAV